MRFPLFFTLIAGTLLSACGGSSSGSTPTTPSAGATSSFSGTIAGSGGQSGTLTVTVPAQVAASSPSLFRWPFVATLHAQATAVAASGSVHVIGGSTTSLSGTFNSSTKAVDLSGGGFTFRGTSSGTVVSGTYTGASVTGVFSSLSTTGGTVSAYCGTIFAGGGAAGVFNLAVSAATGAMSGTFQVFQDSGVLTGQVSGTAFTITCTDQSNGGCSGSGTIQNGALSGISAPDAKPFSGSTSACQ